MSRLHQKLKDEQGIALLISVILMLLISAIGLAALQHPRREAGEPGRGVASARAARDGLRDRRGQGRHRSGTDSRW